VTTIYREGSGGPEVARLQTALGLNGDGWYGPATAKAVAAWQRRAGLAADAECGPATWRALFGEEIPPPSITRAPLAERCLALLSLFETSRPWPVSAGALTGDDDDQGLSHGVCQWCLGQGSLQPLLRKLDAEHPAVIDAAFGPLAGTLRAVLAKDQRAHMEWARSIQTPKPCVILPQWRAAFRALGATPEAQAAQLAAAEGKYRAARRYCTDLGLRSERAVMLALDVITQNGSYLDGAGRNRQRAEWDARGVAEPDRLRAIVARVVQGSRARYQTDVHARKVTCAEGTSANADKGVVHGRRYDLAAEFGITDADAHAV
jgi:hypothetical protein